MTAQTVTELPLSMEEAAKPYILMISMMKTFRVDSFTMFATVVVCLMEAIAFTRGINNV
jgi:hypothetical protein